MVAAATPAGKRRVREGLLRLPTSHGLARLDRQHFPRERYWDVLARRAGCPVLRAEELPGMAGLTCPESSHLDHRDARRLTGALLVELERRGVLPAPAGSRR